MAGPLSLTVDASARKNSRKGSALGFSVSLGLQTAALVSLGVAPLVSLDGLPEPGRAGSVMVLPVVSVPHAPPPAPAKSSARRDRARPPVPSRWLAPSTFASEILPDVALEDFDFDDSPFEGVAGGVPYGIGTPDDSWVPPRPGEETPVLTGPVSVGGVVTPPRKRIHVSPVYPQIALQARVQGTVVLEAIIDVEGNVVNLRVLHSIPLLDAAALDAVRQWKYEPTYLNGRAVPVVMSVNVDFVLAR